MSASLRGKRVLITGGAGFIGSEVTRQAQAAGAEVVVVDNLLNGKRENIADVLGERCRLEVVDIRDSAKVDPLVESSELVYHLACLGVRHSIHSPYDNHAVNAEASLKLLMAARRGGVKRFVYVSTSEVYGTATTVPMTENHPTIPMTVYGAAKLAGECYTRAYHCTYGFPTVVVRPFNAYGPRCHHEGDSGEVIPKFILRSLAGKPMIVFGDGTQTRDFTFVTDTARAILAAGLEDAAIGETINVGFQREIQIKELARAVARVTGRPDAAVEHIEPRPGDVLRLFAEASKARRLLNFQPSVGLEEGLSKLCDYYRSLGRSPEELLEAERVRNWVPA